MRIAIVGAGVTGTLAAIQLARHAAAPIEIVRIDRRECASASPAAARRDDQLVNQPATALSAFADDPAHFVRWLWARERTAADGSPVPPSGHAFVTRRVHAEYLEEMLAELVRAAEPLVTVDRRPRAVARIDRSRRGLTLHFAGGGEMEADHAVLATGPFRARLPVADRRIDGVGARRVLDPWDWESFAWVGANDPVIVLGTGTGMADAVLGLEATGHRGTIRAIGRRGLMPAREAEVTVPIPPFGAEAPPATVSAAVAEIKRAIARAEADAEGGRGGWRRAIDGAAPAVEAVWAAWPDAEKRRFLRHARPFWDASRYRLAPAAAARLDRLIDSGRMTVEAARLPAMVADDNGVRLVVRPGGTGAERIEEAAWLINASGPEVDFARLDEPLIAQLTVNGLARPDRLRLGLAVTPERRLVGRTGAATPGLWTLGPPTRGVVADPLTIPAIRDEAAAFAQHLLAGVMAPEA